MSDQSYSWESYPTDGLVTSEKALFEAWESLEKFRGDLVVVGGLAIHYHAREKIDPLYTGAPTLDVDFGISLGTDAGMKGTVQFDLLQAGYEDFGNRMGKRMENGDLLYIDFLTEHPPSERGSRSVSDITASICPGINRALEDRHFVEICGIDRFGDKRVFQIPICGIGPLLVLKLNAFAKRNHEKRGKDAYDILVVVTSYSGGVAAAVRAFHDEKQKGNPGMSIALETLARDFSASDGAAPTLARRFRYGSGRDDENGLRMQADLVSLAQELLGEDL
jgi:hypothetical protein